MSNGLRWLLAIGLALLVIGLAANARGDEHHRGDEVGALGGAAAALHAPR